MKYFLLVVVPCFFTLQTANVSSEQFNTNPTQSVTIYWDSSLSMHDKNFEKELIFLDAYFKEIQNTNVRLISFSNSIDINKEYVIAKGNWELLKQTLLAINYEGVALYNLLKPKYDSDINLLFTDGNGVFDKLSLKDNKTTYIISTQSNSNNIVLGQESEITKGAHVNLNRLTVEKGLGVLGIKLSYQLKDISSAKKVIKEKGFVTGNVFGFSGALEGATVRVKDVKKGVTTDRKGSFTIKAKKGDKLTIEFLGKKKGRVVVESSDPLTVFLHENENVLKEVAIRNAEKKVELVNTGYGKVDKKKIGYAIRTISEKEINSGVASTLSDAAAGKIGATQNGNRDLTRVIFRGGQTITGNRFPLIVIDGVLLKRSESNPNTTEPKILVSVSSSSGNRADRFDAAPSPSVANLNKKITPNKNKLLDFIDPNNVANLTILKGLAASNRYGSEGVNGVILITTKTFLKNKLRKKKPNTALAKNNDYKEEVSLINDSNSLKHYNVFKARKSLEEVYALYLTKRESNFKNAPFFIEVSNYVLQWGAKDLALKILLNGVETNPTDVSILKYIAYKVEEEGNYEYAIKIYQKILSIKPREAQSYRDLALVYQKSGAFQKSLDLYNAIFNGTYSFVNFSGIRKSINREMKKLILKNKKTLRLLNTPPRFLNIKKDSIQARIVFEWNANNAEFELQFVNPQKKFFKWNHTQSGSASRMAREQTQGFYTEEFLLDDIGTGEWIINIENMNKNISKPQVVRYTLYKNFGGINETTETKLLVLNNIYKKTMVSKIDF